jgi:hypothetical protein
VCCSDGSTLSLLEPLTLVHRLDLTIYYAKCLVTFWEQMAAIQRTKASWRRPVTFHSFPSHIRPFLLFFSARLAYPFSRSGALIIRINILSAQSFFNIAENIIMMLAGGVCVRGWPPHVFSCPSTISSKNTWPFFLLENITPTQHNTKVDQSINTYSVWAVV